MRNESKCLYLTILLFKDKTRKNEEKKTHREAQNCKQTSLTMLNISKNISIFAMLSSS